VTVLTAAERADLEAELHELKQERRRRAFPVQNGLSENEHGREWVCGVLDKWIARREKELASSSAAVTGEDPS
jgi:hypothetical protein